MRAGSVRSSPSEQLQMPHWESLHRDRRCWQGSAKAPLHPATWQSTWPPFSCLSSPWQAHPLQVEKSSCCSWLMGFATIISAMKRWNPCLASERLWTGGWKWITWHQTSPVFPIQTITHWWLVSTFFDFLTTGLLTAGSLNCCRLHKVSSFL